MLKYLDPNGDGLVGFDEFADALRRANLASEEADAETLVAAVIVGDGLEERMRDSYCVVVKRQDPDVTHCHLYR